MLPWLVWIHWLGIILQTKRSQVQFLVRAHAWVSSSVPTQDTCKGEPINVSLSNWCFSPSVSLPSPLSRINKGKRIVPTFLSSLTQKILNTYLVPYNVLATRDTTVNNKQKSIFPLATYISVAETGNNYDT